MSRTDWQLGYPVADASEQGDKHGAPLDAPQPAGQEEPEPEPEPGFAS